MRLRRAPSTVVGSIGLVVMCFLAACGSTASGSSGASAPTATPRPAAVIHTAQATINGQTETVLTDAKGFTLYYFTPDTSTQIACTGACAQNWPPLISTTGTPTSDTPLSVTFGVVNGPNGKQVTCNGHALYTFAGDKAAGDVHGEDVGGIWFVATPGVATLADTSSATVHTGKVTISGKSVTVLTDAKGFTLYYFTPDTATNVACTGSCAQNWPPLMAPSGSPTSDHGLPGKLAAVNGADGAQVTYNGHPLYTFAGDKAAGDANGQGLFGKWFVVKPDLAALS
jgi:predicted lipoprotein with Yx(FWY)xxD motif